MPHPSTAIILGLALAPFAVFAQEPLVGDRPDATESAVTVPVRRFQVETGVTTIRTGREESTEIGELLVRIGLAANTEGRLFVGSWTHVGGGDDGAQNPAVGVKQRFLHGAGAQPELALIAATTLPLGDEAVASPEAEPELVVCAQWDLTPGFGLGLNLGWASLHDNAQDERYASAWLTAALGLAASDRLGFFVEGFGFDRETPDADRTGYLNGGATFLVHPDLQLDARYGRGINGRDDDWFAGAGLVVRR